jgi:hypothetical protein
LERFCDACRKLHHDIHEKLTSMAAIMRAWLAQSRRSTMETGMLSQVYLGSTFSREPEMDIHRHATFSCGISKMVSRITVWWRSRTA